MCHLILLTNLTKKLQLLERIINISKALKIDEHSMETAAVTFQKGKLNCTVILAVLQSSHYSLLVSMISILCRHGDGRYFVQMLVSRAYHKKYCIST